MKIYYHGARSTNLANLASLAKCIGLSTEFVEVESGTALIATLENEMAAPAPPAGSTLDVSSLQDLCNPEQLQKIATLICSTNSSLLLLTTGVHASADQFLEILTGSAVSKAYPGGQPDSISFPGGAEDLARELSSLTYSRERIEAVGLTLDPRKKANVVMRVGQSPSFVHLLAGQASVFVWSTYKVLDVYRPLASEREFEESIDEYVPAVIFLRHSFGDRCWHNPTPSAGLVIDDPLLTYRYGLIDFPRLLESARNFQYHVTLAFIPWNYLRSRLKAVRWFIDHSDCFSICAHGCDHTRNEFRSADYEDLVNRNFLARHRMDRHEQRTGMSWEALMVCPQEEYSLEGLHAFSDSRQFLALVNTSCIPREGSANRMCAADLLLPAQDSYFGFPIFKRHYWNNMSVFAMALFLGKPAILVEHHEFFRNGPGGVETFVSRLIQISPRLRWTSLFKTVIQTHTRRRLESGNLEIRFFTDTFEMEHPGTDALEYQLTRRVPDSTIVQRVTVNGTEVPYTREYESLNFRIHADQPQLFSVQVKVLPVQPTKSYSLGIKYDAAVAVRRILSELRDNVIVRNEFAFKTAKSVMRMLRQTGGG